MLNLGLRPSLEVAAIGYLVGEGHMMVITLENEVVGQAAPPVSPPTRGHAGRPGRDPLPRLPRQADRRGDRDGLRDEPERGWRRDARPRRGHPDRPPHGSRRVRVRSGTRSPRRTSTGSRSTRPSMAPRSPRPGRAGTASTSSDPLVGGSPSRPRWASARRVAAVGGACWGADGVERPCWPTRPRAAGRARPRRARSEGAVPAAADPGRCPGHGWALGWGRSRPAGIPLPWPSTSTPLPPHAAARR